MPTASISPFDQANRETIAHGHPADWNPPQPKDMYDFVIIGGGPAGLPAAFMATMGGHSVAVIERNLTGGTCVNFGCTPSKALLRAARAVFEAHDGQKFGYALDGQLQVDFAAVMIRVRKMRAASSAPPAVASLARAGIDVFLGDGRFVSPSEVKVNGRRIAFTKALIATGSRPTIPRRARLGRLRVLHERDSLRVDFSAATAGLPRRRHRQLRACPGISPAGQRGRLGRRRRPPTAE